MRVFPRSLRWRLSAVIALVSVVLAVALSLLVRSEFSRAQLADARRVQDERIQLVVRDYGLTGRAALGSRIDATDVPEELLGAVRGGRRATYLQRTPDGAWIWA
ncbi:MAG: two-component sensor histidine kinase, partial [Actinomycetota bacterium]|nr:two-component sensor histidine kinase [Actinomycetota bacterium]